MLWVAFLHLPILFATTSNAVTPLQSHFFSANVERIPESIGLYKNDDHHRDLDALANHHDTLRTNPNFQFVAYRGGGPAGALGERNHGQPFNLSPPLGAIPTTPARCNQFVAKIAVGTPPQYFNVILDTGSTNIWLIDEKCPSQTCRKVSRFNPSKSSTFHRNEEAKRLDITFGTGRIFGSTAFDRLSVGPFSVAHQGIGLVEVEDGRRLRGPNTFDLINFEGILGLGFKGLLSTGGEPFFDALVDSKALEEPNFSFHFVSTRRLPSADVNSPSGEADRAGTVLFGGIDDRLYHAPLRFVPVVREHYWEVVLNEFWVGDHKFCCDGDPDSPHVPSYAIFDSGTTYNTLPSREMSAFLRLMPTDTSCSEQDAASPSRLDEEGRFPTLKYVLEPDLEVEIKPSMYLLFDNAQSSCRPAFMQLDVPSEFGHAYVFGSVPFMQHYFTTFRRRRAPEPSEVGIALARHDHDFYEI